MKKNLSSLLSEFLVSECMKMCKVQFKWVLHLIAKDGDVWATLCFINPAMDLCITFP